MMMEGKLDIRAAVKMIAGGELLHLDSSTSHTTKGRRSPPEQTSSKKIGNHQLFYPRDIVYRVPLYFVR